MFFIFGRWSGFAWKSGLISSGNGQSFTMHNMERADLVVVEYTVIMFAACPALLACVSADLSGCTPCAGRPSVRDSCNPCLVAPGAVHVLLGRLL